MKIMVLSDIHNDTDYLSLALKIFKDENFDKLYLLGDIGVDAIYLLNDYAAKIVAVKGNCDSYDEEEASKFNLPLINFDYQFNKFIVLSHGDFYAPYNYEDKYDIFLHGHTHHSYIYKTKDEKIAANPGSLARPRDYYHSYMVIDEKGIKIIDIDSKSIINSLEF